jgi:DNA-directed RNA polymerase subunit RPC12/RpoP
MARTYIALECGEAICRASNKHHAYRAVRCNDANHERLMRERPYALENIAAGKV